MSLSNVNATIAVLVCLFVIVLGSPIQENDKLKSPTLNRQKRTFGLGLFGPRDWTSLHHTWRLPAFPTMPSVMNFFDDEELHVSFAKRISDLEQGQRRIIDYLRKLQAEQNANLCNKNLELPEKLPEPVAESASSKSPVTEAAFTKSSPAAPDSTPQTTEATLGSTTEEFRAEQQVTTTREEEKTEQEVPTTIPPVEETTTAVDESIEANDVMI